MRVSRRRRRTQIDHKTHDQHRNYISRVDRKRAHTSRTHHDLCTFSRGGCEVGGWLPCR